MKTIPYIIFSSMLFSATAMTQDHDSTAAVTTQRAYEMIQSDSTIVILDVRRLDEFTSETGHLKGAILIPVQELEDRLKELEPYKDKTIIAVCRTGRRSGNATILLNEKGFRALNLVGGIVKWNEEKLPVVKEE